MTLATSFNFNKKTSSTFEVIQAVIRTFKIRFILLISVSFASSLFSQQNETNSDAQKVVKVCTLNTTEANQEFQRNVQLLRLQREKVGELQERLDKTENVKERDEIQKSLDDMLKKINENNELMFNAYGFSLTRNYTMVVEKAHVYMLVNEEEAKKFEALQENQPESANQ